MYRLFVSSVLVACLTTPVAAQDVARALVCPPRLDYCYYIEKPVLAKPRGDDMQNSITQVMDCIRRDPSLIAECRRLYGLPY